MIHDETEFPEHHRIKVGQQCGHLTVQATYRELRWRKGIKGRRRKLIWMARCVCRCGRVRSMRIDNLLKKRWATKSCGSKGCRASSRPLFDERLSRSLYCGVTDAEHTRIEADADKANLPIAYYIRTRLGLKVPDESAQARGILQSKRSRRSARFTLVG